MFGVTINILVHKGVIIIPTIPIRRGKLAVTV